MLCVLVRAIAPEAQTPPEMAPLTASWLYDTVALHAWEIEAVRRQSENTE